MTLEATYSEKSQIPSGLESHYEEQSDGSFVLSVTGMKTEADFDKYAEALKKRFADSAADFSKRQQSGISRDDVLGMIDEAAKKFTSNNGSNGQQGNGGTGSEDLAARVHDLERTVGSLTETNTKLQKERDDALMQNRGTTIRNQLKTSALAAGAEVKGVDNLVQLVENNFEVAQDGQVVTKLDAGAGVSPNQQPADYFAALARQETFRMFWPASKGAGADNGGGAGGGSGNDLGAENPWSKAGWNMTKQGKMLASNPQEADRLMKAAGVGLGAVAPVR